MNISSTIEDFRKWRILSITSVFILKSSELNNVFFIFCDILCTPFYWSLIIVLYNDKQIHFIFKNHLILIGERL